MKIAKTRDGRDVFNVRRAILDGDRVLIGEVAIDRPPYKPGKIIKTESMYWGAGGLGRHGGDDLMEVKK